MSLKFFETIEAQIRPIDNKKSTLSAVRDSKNIPGIIYMKSGKNMNIQIHVNSFQKLLLDPAIKTRIIEIKIDKKNIICILKDVQFHPVTDIPTHFDFQEIVRGDMVKVSVPIRVLNKDKCIGVKRGGDVYLNQYNVILKCKAENILTSIDLDVEHSTIGQKFRLSQIKLPEDCLMVEDVLLGRVSGKRVIAETVAVVANAETTTETAAVLPAANAKTPSAKPATKS